MIKQATNSDRHLMDLREIIEEGSLMDNPLVGELAAFSRHRESLWTHDGVILIGARTVVPKQLRSRVCRCLHSAHQGVAQMYARAESSVYWPGLYKDLEKVRNECQTCRTHAPSNPKLPPVDPPKMDFPFQEVCCDYMSLNGTPYLVTVDRCTNWPDVRRARGENRGAQGLVCILRDLFTTFGIPEVLTSDGGPEFTSSEVQEFLGVYGVRHRFSSVGNPHSNQRAEVGVKSMKRLLRGNIGPLGNLDNEKFAMAIMQYRNTPVQSTGISPAIALFGRHLKDFIPLSPGNYAPSPQWMRKLIEKENKQAKAHLREKTKWSEHTRQQEPLQVGHQVSVQNLAGNYPLKWDKTGIVVEVKQFDQYGVKLDGSNRITYRNRKNLRIIGFKKPQDPFPASIPSPLLLGGRKEKQQIENTKITTPAKVPLNTPIRIEESPGFETPMSSPQLTSRTLTFNPVATDTPTETPKKPKNQEIPRLSRRIVTDESRPAQPAAVSASPVPMAIHRELRGHMKSGPKDVVPTDLSGPMKTRSGMRLQSKK